MMTDMEILKLADKCGVLAVRKHEWDGKQFNHTDDYLDGDGAALIVFAKQMMAQRPWVGLMRGARVEGDTVVIKVQSNNEARLLCSELVNEMEKNT